MQYKRNILNLKYINACQWLRKKFVIVKLIYSTSSLEYLREVPSGLKSFGNFDNILK